MCNVCDDRKTVTLKSRQQEVFDFLSENLKLQVEHEWHHGDEG